MTMTPHHDTSSATSVTDGRAGGEALHRRALDAWREGRLEQAEALLQQACRSCPEETLLQHNLGLLLEDMGRQSQAEALYREILVRQPDNARVCLRLAHCHEAAARFGEAEAHYRQAAALLSESVEGLNELGAFLQRRERLEEAADCFLEILQRDVTCRHAYLSLGNIYDALGRLEEAFGVVQNLLLLHPDQSEIYGVLGELLERQGDHDQAAHYYRTGIEKEPDGLDCWVNLARLCYEQDQSEQALACYDRILTLRPDDAVVHNNVALIHRQERNWEQAIEALRRAVELDPDYVEAYRNLGLTYEAAERYDEAVACFQTALERWPDNPSLMAGLGQMYRMRGTQDHDDQLLEQALEVLHRGLELDDKGAVLHENLGLTYKELHRYDEALHYASRAVTLNPDSPTARSNLGAIYQRLGRLDEALVNLERAVAMNPGFVGGYNNLGMALFDADRAGEALENYQQALTMPMGGTDRSRVLWNRSTALLSLGRLGEGWDDYEEGFLSGERRPNRQFTIPRWQGEDLGERTLLLWPEQGLGDQFMFATCVPDILARAGHCVIECSVRLVALFQRSFPGATVRTVSNDPRGADYHLPLGSLPRFFRRCRESFPDRPGYLLPDRQKAALWRQRVEALGPGLKVGICWRSGLRTDDRMRHYTALEQWAPLFAVPGITFVSLQYDECEEELAAAEARFGIRLHRWDDIDQKQDLDGVAALMSNLDLVISAATAVGEMAGALGMPVWRFGMRAHWSDLGDEHRPWFPSMRVFRKAWHENWDPLMARMAQSLTEYRPEPFQRPYDRQPLVAAADRHRSVGELDRLAEQILQQAADCHREGRLQEAAFYYQEILNAVPDHVEALHLLGLLQAHQGQRQPGVELLQRAIALRPHDPALHASLAGVMADYECSDALHA